MRMRNLLPMAGMILLAHFANAQVKIGDNPQSIDPASLLELESSDRVLVITRVSTAQMNAINPSLGAIVYNTEAQCLFYYDGTEWRNICDSLPVEFTAEAIVNVAPTIIITETGDQVNFEVGEIRGTNILDFSIGSQDIQNNSINSDKLAPNSVGTEELQDNTITDAELDYAAVTLADFTNDAGFITSADLISGDPGNDLTAGGDNGVYFDAEPLEVMIFDNADAIAANAAAIAADGDTDSNNEIQDISLAGNSLSISGGSTVDLSGFNNAGTDDQNLTLTGNTLSIESGNSVNLSPFLDNTDTQTLSLTGNNLNITGGNSVDLSGLTGIGGSTEVADLVTIVGDGTGGDPFRVADGGIGTTQLADLAVTTAKINATAVTAAKIANNAVTTAKINAAAVTTPKIADISVTPAKIQPSATDGQVLTTVAGAAQWADPAGGGNPTDELVQSFQVNGINLELTDAGNVFQVPVSTLGTDDQTAGEVGINYVPTNYSAPDQNANTAEDVQDHLAGIDVVLGNFSGGTEGQVLTTTGGNVVWQDPAGGGGAASSVSFVTYNSLNAGNVQGVVEQLKDELDAALLAGGADGVLSNVVTTGTNLDFTGTISSFNGSIDLQPLVNTAGTNLGYLTAEVDGDITNEIQTLSILGSDLTLSNGGGTITIPSSADGVVSNVAVAGTQLAFTGANGGFNASINLEPLVDAAASNNGFLTAEVDGDITNEIQTLSILGSDLSLSNGGGTVTLPSGGADGVVSNVAVAGTQLAFTGANGGFNASINLEPLVDAAASNNGFLTAEVDGDITNEIQTLSILGSDLSLSNGGGTVTLPSGIVSTDATLTGNGTVGNPLGIADDAIQGGIGGVILDNSITAADLAPNSVDQSELQADSVGESEIQSDAVTTLKILDGTILDGDINGSANIAGTKILANFGGQDVITSGNFISGGTTLNVPDYVFQRYFLGSSTLDPDYRMASLEEVRAYVEENHHLPGVTSAAEVEVQGGIILNEATNQNLEKIEELFLHTIEQEQKIETLQTENAALQQEMEEMKAQMARIEALLNQNPGK